MKVLPIETYPLAIFKTQVETYPLGIISTCVSLNPSVHCSFLCQTYVNQLIVQFRIMCQARRLMIQNIFPLKDYIIYVLNFVLSARTGKGKFKMKRKSLSATLCTDTIF